MWLQLEDVREAALVGRILEIPAALGRYRVGESIEVRGAEVEDWMVRRNGTLLGGFSHRVKRDLLPKSERRAFDLYSGTISYLPAEEIDA